MKNKGILVFIGLGTLLAITLWKSFIDKIGLTGSATNLGIAGFLHHSRYGAIMVLISGAIFYFEKREWYNLAWILLVIGAVLIMQHLAIEKCFTVVGGLC